MPNYSEAEMRRLAAMLGNNRIAGGVMTNQDMTRLAGNAQATNILPIPMNENNMPMFNTDAEYMEYLNEYDPAMFNEMQNTYYNTKGTMGEGKIEPMQYIKGLLGL
jgi:hypothetical protein